eukprot:928876-Prymnesium_polylepis.1
MGAQSTREAAERGQYGAVDWLPPTGTLEWSYRLAGGDGGEEWLVGGVADVVCALDGKGTGGKSAE